MDIMIGLIMMLIHIKYLISHQSIRNTFARKKGKRQATKRMVQAFAFLKVFKSSGRLKSFHGMPLRVTN